MLAGTGVLTVVVAPVPSTEVVLTDGVGAKNSKLTPGKKLSNLLLVGVKFKPSMLTTALAQVWIRVPKLTPGVAELRVNP